MSKIEDKTRKQIAALEAKYKNLTERKKLLERKDWFLVEVKFTPESLEAYQSKLKSYPDELATWTAQKAQTLLGLPMMFVRSMEPMQPLRPSAYGMSDFPYQGLIRQQVNCHIETDANGSSEKWAVRASQFAQLEQKPHILSITVLDQGERVAALVEETLSKRQAERLAQSTGKNDAQRPAPRAPGESAPAP
jgi:hypothetical protein